jgi:hypothetical protein
MAYSFFAWFRHSQLGLLPMQMLLHRPWAGEGWNVVCFCGTTFNASSPLGFAVRAWPWLADAIDCDCGVKLLNQRL